MQQCTPLSRNRDSETQKLGRFFKNENKNKVVGVTKMKIYGLDCLPLADSRREKKNKPPSNILFGCFTAVQGEISWLHVNGP